MKIAINGVRVSRQGGGGIDHYIIHLVNHLGKLGLDFDLFTFSPRHFSGVNPSKIKEPFSFFSRNNDVTSESIPSSDAKQNKNETIRGWFARNFGDHIKMSWTQYILPFILKSGGYSVLFSPSQLDAIPYPHSSIKQVITLHDLIPFVLKDQKHKHLFFLKKFLPVALKNSAHIIAVSEHTKRDAVKIFGLPAEKITTVHEARPLLAGNQAYPSPEEVGKVKEKYGLKKYILCVSGNHPHKNIRGLIKAYALIKERIDCKLVIAGYQDKGIQAGLDQLAKDENVEDRVLFLGHVPSEALPSFYCGAELFVFPSLYEGFGLPPLEALYYGVPVIVSRSSSLPEVVGDAGLYFEPENFKELAEKMEKVLTDKELREKLKKLGPERAKNFSWEKAAKETFEVFKKVAGE